MEQKVTLKQKIQSENFMYKLSGISLIVYSLSKIFWLYYENLVQILLDEELAQLLEEYYLDNSTLIFTRFVIPTLFYIVLIISGVLWIKRNYEANLILTGIMSVYPVIYIVKNLRDVCYDIFETSRLDGNYDIAFMSLINMATYITLLATFICQFICIFRKKHSKPLGKIWITTIIMAIIHFVSTLFDKFLISILACYLFIAFLCWKEIDETNVLGVLKCMFDIFLLGLPYILRVVLNIFLPIHVFFCGKALRK